ncbi:acetyl-CoA hydrolase/transferase family protein [Thermosipho ferrireducens]|uniref:Acetyl-CoA hydrolase/transferase family protein n=1 Tax=Thermosipho ferrireducens TaxID=2571116 RepID=A0ABX7S6P4_9BACT|nr:acetyl-CoA hydrolase/transferase C-terminal domain-containing protein [Thermosipho ferrireducens]QTA37435.1 acetyl-CoA hydrolase/transferase family protein [Thermosipho ferrireducens]
MDWKEVYNRKKADIENIIKLVHSNSVIVVGMTPMEPKVFLRNLHKAEASNVDVFTCLNTEEYDFFMDEKFGGLFRNNSWFFGASNRKAWKEKYKTVFYVPNNLHQAGTNLLETRDVDLYIGVASPMDSKGFLTLSASVVYEKDVVEKAKKVVLEVNPNAPRTHGDTQVHISDVDYIVEVNYKLPEVELLEPSELEKRIAFNIVDLIQDGSTIQLGIGGIPNAVAKFLVEKRDLGVHTEMFTESMVDLFEAGVINNKRKTLWPGKFVCTFAYGTERMYQFIDDNPAVFFLRGRYVNDPYVISQNEKMVSINTALMVDLTGNVCSEAIGTNHYSGTGGQLDTHRGAVKSRDGKGIIAIRSTAKNGTISTIVPLLPEGSPVTIPRQELDYVVTEWGVVQLRGKSVKARAEALISIAHPEFRKYLKKEAQKLGLI